MKTLVLINLCVLLMLSCNQQEKDHQVWLEENGMVLIEAENAANVPEDSGWSKEDSLEAFRGTGYMVWRGKGDWGPESRPYDTISQVSRKLTYLVEIQTPGTYYLKVRNQHKHEDGDNDVWTSVNGSDWGKTYDWQENEWSLDERGTWAKYQLGKGTYKVELAGRSGGFAVDRLILFLENTPEEKLDQPIPESKIMQKASLD